jgi:hypothetical protein
LLHRFDGCLVRLLIAATRFSYLTVRQAWREANRERWRLFEKVR